MKILLALLLVASPAIAGDMTQSQASVDGTAISPTTVSASTVTTADLIVTGQAIVGGSMTVAGAFSAGLGAIGANTGDIVIKKSGGELTTDAATLTWDSTNDIMSVNGLSVNANRIRVAASGQLEINSANGNGSFALAPAAAENVGIGTYFPASKLHMSSGTLTLDGTGAAITVAGSALFGSGATKSTFTATGILTANAPSNGSGITANGSGTAGAAAIALKLRTESTASADYRDWALFTNAAVNGGLSIGVGASALADPYNATYVMQLSKEGRVGIGTTGPSTALSVYGVVTSSTTQPTISCNAGTGVVLPQATNQHGRFTGGAASINCTLTFSTEWPKTPSCWCQNETTLLVVRAVATTSTLVCHSSLIGTDTLNYGCMGAP